MSNIFDVAQPFMVILKVSGLFPVSSLKANHKSSCKIRAENLIIFLTSIAIVFIVAVINILNLTSLESSSSTINGVWNVSWMIGLLALTVMIPYQWKKSDVILELLEVIDQIDSKVRVKFECESENQFAISDEHSIRKVNHLEASTNVRCYFIIDNYFRHFNHIVGHSNRLCFNVSFKIPCASANVSCFWIHSNVYGNFLLAIYFWMLVLEIEVPAFERLLEARMSFDLLVVLLTISFFTFQILQRRQYGPKTTS